MPGEAVPCRQFDGFGTAVHAAVVQLHGLTAPRVLKLPGHCVGNTGQMGEDVATGPARKFRRFGDG